jgi:glycosyltransferase involved in cell wall biosynthesis
MRVIKKFQPDVMIYIPRASASLFNLLRGKILQSYWKSKLVLFVLQPNSFNFVSKKFAKFLKPDLILSTSILISQELNTIKLNSKPIPLGVDINKFKPVSTEQKLFLRSKYNLDVNKYLILHIGHVTMNRNLEILLKLNSVENQVIIISSVSQNYDKILLDTLKKNGVIIIKKYLNNIEEFYQLSDCYIFPVESKVGSINFPLSILEAMACNLPIITTNYGGLNDIFPEMSFFKYINTGDDITSALNNIKLVKEINSRSIIMDYTWNCIIEKYLLPAIEEVCDK